MNSLNEKLTVAAIVLGVVFLGLLVATPILVEHTKDRVIQELRNPYTPGPYTPGFDPDRVDPNYFRNSQQPQYPQQQLPPQQQQPWLSSWEQQRFSGT